MTIAGSSSNSATTFNVYGGSLTGAAKVLIGALNLNLALPFTVSGYVILI